MICGSIKRIWGLQEGKKEEGWREWEKERNLALRGRIGRKDERRKLKGIKERMTEEGKRGMDERRKKES